MTVTTQTFKDQYYGDGLTASFPVITQFQNASELLVTILSVDGLTETTKTLGSHYNVTGGNGNGGTVIFTGGNIPTGNGLLGASQRITISRKMPLTQITDLTENDPFPANSVERSFGDRLIMVAQFLQEQINRCIKLQVSSILVTPPTLLDPVANRVLLVAADGLSIGAGPLASDIANAQSNAAIATAAASSAAASAASVNPANFLAKASNLSDLLNASTALTNLGGSVIGKTIFSSADAAAVKTAIGLSNSILTVKRQVFTANGTYTPSTGMLYCDVEMWGGGGGGGGVTSGAAIMGGGGGAGGVSRARFLASDIGASKAVVIGAGGIAGANTGGNGGVGGNTSLGALLSAGGGAGGAGNSATNAVAPVGTGGSGTYDGTATRGAAGKSGSCGSGISVSAYMGGGGGDTSLGGGGAAIQGGNNIAGNNGLANSGGGGSGGASNTAAQLGGVGGSGYMIITEYCSQ